MRILKIQFADFWVGFAPADNYFFRLLSSFCKVEISDEPELLIYSCYGSKHLEFTCIKVFYTAENLRPDFFGCDFAISFDYNDDPRHYRLPLYALYIDQPGSMDKMIEKKTKEEALNIWRNKKKFCCMVVSNGQSKKRLEFFEKLSKYKRVDSGGKVMNNIGGPVVDKMSFIKDYRFVISFENASYSGYTTEKIAEPFLMDSIPVYWGDPLIYQDFNKACFLNLDKTKSEAELIDEIIAIDQDEEKAAAMLQASKFAGGSIPADIDKERLIHFFEEILHKSAVIVPVAKTWKNYIHIYKVRKLFYISYAKGLIKRFTPGRLVF